MTPPREKLAAHTRKVVEAFHDWDSLNTFQTLRWEDGEIRIGTHGSLDPAIRPSDLPKWMVMLASKEHQESPDHPACAYLLQIEGHTVTPSEGWTAHDYRQLEMDMAARTLHLRPDAVEQATAWCADVHGRLWVAGKRRDRPGEITEEYHPPGTAPRAIGIVEALLALAAAGGVIGHGLPLPPGFSHLN